ncbi:MAG: acyl carrier protein [Desulfobacterales bacterium RIFOXYA12_FULL_46_15]|nr:MAG: acyl carrier protein [Desulfobacterales bacterium RIFOXYA12_FULL_46_15]
MDILKETIGIIRSVLNIGIPFDRDVQLLGNLPEFDSQAVVALITTLEEQLGIFIEDDEITAEVFETVGTLVDFLEQKM